MASAVLVELQATTSEFMAKMAEARAEVTKLGTEGSGASAKFGAVSAIAFAAAGAAIVGVGAIAVKSALEYSESVATIEGNAQLTAKAAQGIGDAFLKTAGSSIYSGKQMADAFGPVSGVVQAMSGHTLTAADSLKFMAAAGNLAEASSLPLGSTTADLSSTMRAFGLSTNDAGEASNTLFNTARITGMGLDSLSATVNKLHGRLGIVAPSLSDTSTLLVDLANHGISGSRGALIVNTAMTTLLGGTKPVNAELKALGVNVFDSQGKFVGMQAVLAQLQPKFAGMSDQQRQLAEATLFGTSAASAMNNTIMDGVGGWQKASAAVDAHGAVEKAAEAQSSTLARQIQKLKAGAEDYATLLGEKLIPIITSVVTWVSKHKDIALALTGIIAGLVVGLATYYAVTKTIEVATKAWSAAQAALNVVMDANPIMLVVIAIAALVVAFVEVYQHCTAFRDAVNDAWTFIKQAFDDGLAFVKAHMDLIGAALILIGGPISVVIGAALLLWNNWKTIWDAIQTTLQAVWSVIKPIFDALIDILQVTIVDPLKILGDVFQIVWALISLAVRTAWQVMKLEIDAGVAVYNAVVAPALHALGSVFSTVWGAISGAVSAAWGVVRPVLSAIVDAGIGPVKSAASGLASAWNGVWGGIKTAVSDAWNFIRPIFDTIKSAVQDVTNAIGKVTGIAGKVTGGITGVLGKLASGGPAAANTPYVIGEEGPEIFVPDQAGTVLPHSVFAGTGRGTPLGIVEPKLSAGARSVTVAQGAVQVIVHGDVHDGNVDTVTGAIDDAMRQLVVEIGAT